MTSPFTTQEFQHYRSLFPVTKNWIYLNHAGVAPISIRVAEAVAAFNRQALDQGFTASAEWIGRIAETRRLTARLIHATEEEIAFVKNTSHGISLVARGLGLKEGDEVIISEGEFPSNIYPWMALGKQGVRLIKIPVQHGELQLDDLEKLVTPRTRVISLSTVQYGNGYRLPVAEIGRLCREKGIHFLLDAIQSLGAFSTNVGEAGVDFLAADAHKWMLGHEGIGIFYVRKELLSKIEPMLLGWNSVEEPLAFDKIHFQLRKTAERFEEGSHNCMSIYGLGAALDLLLEIGVDRISSQVLHLTQLCIEGLQSLGMELTCSLQPKFRSGIVTFRIPGDVDSVKIQQLERFLYSQKIYAAVRSGSLRLSPHFYNSEEDISTTLKTIEGFLRKH